MDTFKMRFKKQIAGELQKELGIKNIMAVPFLSKIVVNMGVKDAVADKKNLVISEKKDLNEFSLIIWSSEWS